MALPGDLTAQRPGRAASPAGPASPAQLLLGGLALTGRSRAGEESWLRLQPPGIAFDVGRGAPELEGCGRLFLSHGHLDHAVGLPFLLSRRAAAGAPETRVYAPAPIVPRLGDFVAAAERLEEREYDWRLEGLAAGDRVPVDDRHTVEAFAVDHGVASLGYLLSRRRRLLLEEHRDRPEADLAAMRRAGAVIDEVVWEPWLAYCGDSGPAVFALEPRLLTVPILVLECTFLDPAQRDNAARYRHLHFDDLAERGEDLCNESIVLVHLSRRHRAEDLRRLLAERLPRLAPRIHVFGAEE